MRQMGGLGKQMPLARVALIIGALALAGIPILNGFWSKELVLEAGFAGGPVWAYVVMLIGAGLTALYTFRFLTMVFFGERRAPLKPATSQAEVEHVHDAGPAMKTALIPLALGTLVTWLLAGAFWEFLASALPVEEHEVEATTRILTKVATAPATFGVLAVVAIGVLAWFVRRPLAGVAQRARAHRLGGHSQLRLRSDQQGSRFRHRGVGGVAARHADRAPWLERARHHPRARRRARRPGDGRHVTPWTQREN